MNHKLSSAYSTLVEILMAIAWVGLPFTSFPVLGWITNSQAAPLSAIPVGIVLIIWLVPQLFKGQKLPMEVMPLLGFVLVAIASSMSILFLDHIPFEGRSFIGQSTRALFTLGVGFAFYTVVASRLQTEGKLIRAMQYIHMGGVLMLLWGLIQLIVISTSGGHFPPLLDRIRTWLVIQPYGVQIGNRLSALAYEPSWFAHQLNMLYLPLWLASTYQRQSVFRFRLFKLSLENILLALGLIEFVLSRPRVGFAALVLVIGYVFINITVDKSKHLSQLIMKRSKTTGQDTRRKTALLTLLIGLGFCILFVAIVAGVAYIGSMFDERLALLFKPIPNDELLIIKALDENTLMYLGARLQFLERTIYWILGWHIFNDYPILGVGLGNTGFYAYSHLPATAWMTTEIRDLVYRLGYMINTKSYWLRILAETGLAGFAFFAAWFIGLWRSARYLIKCKQKTFMLIGMAAQLALLAFLFEGFSLDSFALPYLWVTAGMLSGARMSVSQNNSQGNTAP